MFKYKRKINEINSLHKSSFVTSDKVNTTICLNSDFTVRKPFNGLYIKNGKVIISNLFEQIETKENKYSINNIISSVKSYDKSNDEYILSVDLENFFVEYDMDEAYFSKKLYLEEKTGILAIEYEIYNKSKYDMTFKVFPAITYRDIYIMKNASMLKFNQRDENNEVVINLSILNGEDVILKSDRLAWNKDVNFLNNITYHVREDNVNLKEYVEDLLVPGYFDLCIKSDEHVKAVIYVLPKEKDISKINTELLSKKDFFIKENISNSIEHEYVELKELSYGIDKLKLENFMIDSLPYYGSSMLSMEKVNIDNINKTLNILINCVKAVEGQYLSFGKIKEATRRTLEIKKYIEAIDKIRKEKEFEYETLYKILILKLWWIESINRIIQKQDLYNVFFSFVKYIVNSIFSDKLFDEYFKNIEAVALMYNALKIYEDMLKKDGKEENAIFVREEYFRNKIHNEFWNEEKRVLKKNLDEKEIYANIEMLYTISLSYPCIVSDIKFRLLDTVFKELYTPYGLREFSKNSSRNTGLIYPKYMAHFVKANLRQNGVTRASRKIAFNLVKDLFLDINKYLNCGVKKVYSEKGYQIDTLPYDLLTNAEIIRLYDMLL